MDKSDYIRFVIKPTLDYIDPEVPYSDAAVALILLTALAESNLSKLAQYNDGPARGLLQMEPETEKSLWQDYLNRKHALSNKIQDLTIKKINREINAAGNLFYQVAMARVKYWPDPESLPKISETSKMVNYYLRIYNGGGKAEFDIVKNIYQKRVLN